MPLLLLSIGLLLGAFFASAAASPAATAGLSTSRATPAARVHLRVDRAGDVNCDSLTNSVDAALILQQSAGLPATLACSFHGDVSHDRQVNAVDATVILQWIAGLLDILSL
jgi:hypothetical protein